MITTAEEIIELINSEIRINKMNKGVLVEFIKGYDVANLSYSQYDTFRSQLKAIRDDDNAIYLLNRLLEIIKSMEKRHKSEGANE